MDDTTALTGDDIAFLRRPLYGFLSTVTDGPPEPRPVWFEVTPHGTLALFTAPDAAKVRRLRADPRASLVVAAPVGERERWVSVTGRATIEDGGRELLARLAPRYWDLENASCRTDLERMLGQDWLRIEVRPRTVRRYAM
jgi:nitroimidazol reductase NimA-like FMN-containing flavoprotein (pyridoxamine 5'-phosphate oxidase superfamily)